MYVLVIVMPAQMDGEEEIRRFVGRSKESLLGVLSIYDDCLAWRMTDKEGSWADGTPEAWRLIQNAYGTAQIVC